MKQIFIFLILSLFINLYVHADNSSSKAMEVTRLKKTDMGQYRIPYNGVFIDGVKWTDTEGNHIVFSTTTGLYNSHNTGQEDGMNVEIFTYHYTYGDDVNFIKRLWEFSDSILDCPLATTLEFIDGSLQVTDLNNDGVAEIWLVYRGGCSGDIAPFGMSIVMYEGNKKYTIDGNVKITLPENKQVGGEYKLDQYFQNLSGEFRQYASKLWEKYCFYFDYSKE